MTPCSCRKQTLTSRRDFLQNAGGGLGMLALASLLQSDGLLAADVPASNPLAPKAPHFKTKAKSVIFLFMSGGFISGRSLRSQAETVPSRRPANSRIVRHI